MHEIKKTGIEWLPEISKDFSVGYVKQYFNISKDLSNEGEPERVLKLARSGIVEKDVTMNEGQMAASYAGYNKVLVGDLLLNPMDLYSGANCNVSQLDGVISPAYLNLRAKKAQTVVPKFYDYYFKTQYWIMAMFAHGKGVSFDNRWTLNNDSLRSYEIPVLPYLSQKRIVQKIQSEEQNVDALIVNQQTQIEKLKQYKQSLITEVVTKGLNPNVPMKDSGTLKLGNIPDNWKIVRFKNVAILCNGKEVTSNNGNIPVYGSGGVFKYTDQPLFTGTSLLLGRKGTIDNPMLVTDSFWTVDTMFYTSKIYGINPKYLYYACVGEIDFNYYKSGSVLPSMTQTEINNIFITCPDRFEQKKIVDFLDKKCAKIDRLIAIKQEKINKINDYKKSLIYEYVTGKKEA